MICIKCPGQSICSHTCHTDTDTHIQTQTHTHAHAHAHAHAHTHNNILIREDVQRKGEQRGGREKHKRRGSKREREREREGERGREIARERRREEDWITKMEEAFIYSGDIGTSVQGNHLPHPTNRSLPLSLSFVFDSF